MTTSYDAVVLAGGAARRLGGTDKPALSIGGRILLDRVLTACAGAGTTVVVGPRRPTARPVRWTREQPPGGGPLPALAAGLTALDDVHRSGVGGVRGPGPDTGHASGPARPEVVLVLAADLPFLTADTAVALVAALTVPPERGHGHGHGQEEGAGEGAGGDGNGSRNGSRNGNRNGGTRGEGAMLMDSGGRDQPLAAAYRIEALRRELALIGTEHGGLTGLPLRLLTGELELRRIADPTGDASFDCDTWEDVAEARARLDAASEG